MSNDENRDGKEQEKAQETRNPHSATTVSGGVAQLLETLMFQLDMGRYVRPRESNNKTVWMISDDEGDVEDPCRPIPDSSAQHAALQHGWLCLVGECLTVTRAGMRFLNWRRAASGCDVLEYDWAKALENENSKAPYEWELSRCELARLRFLDVLAYGERRAAFSFIEHEPGNVFRVWSYTLRGPLGYPACGYPESVLKELCSLKHVELCGRTARITKAGWRWYYSKELELDQLAIVESEAINWEYVLQRGQVPAASMEALLELKGL